MWFAARGELRSIGEINPTTHQFIEYPIPSTVGNLNPNPYAIAAGPDGNIWFTELGATESIGGLDRGTIESIGELDLSTHAISQYTVPGIDLGGIAAGPDGKRMVRRRGVNR